MSSMLKSASLAALILLAAVVGQLQALLQPGESWK
jgi:hypothetical protein